MVEARRHEARGGARKREAGAGARHRLVFVGRLVATLIHLRHDLPHAALGLLFGVDRSTVARAIGEIRGLLAERGCAVPDRPGLRLRTLADVFAYAQAEGIEPRSDATEVQERTAPGRPRRAPCVRLGQGETEHDEGHRRRRPPGPHPLDRRPAARADARRDRRTQRRHRYLFPALLDVEVLLDNGYLGLRRDHPGQAVTPPRKGNKISPLEALEARLRARHRHSSKRIAVEHALADHKRWKQLVRWTHRRETLPVTYRAIAGPVSDRNTTG